MESYDATRRLHAIEYEDGDTEDINLDDPADGKKVALLPQEDVPVVEDVEMAVEDSVPVPRRDSLISEMAVVGRPSIGSKGNSRTPTPVKNSFLDCNPVALSASRSLRPASPAE